MASPTTRGPIETELLFLLNKTEPVTIEEVQTLLTDLLTCVRDDVYYHRTFEGKTTPERTVGQ